MNVKCPHCNLSIPVVTVTRRKDHDWSVDYVYAHCYDCDWRTAETAVDDVEFVQRPASIFTIKGIVE